MCDRGDTLWCQKSVSDTPLEPESNLSCMCSSHGFPKKRKQRSLEILMSDLSIWFEVDFFKAGSLVQPLALWKNQTFIIILNDTF